MKEVEFEELRAEAAGDWRLEVEAGRQAGLVSRDGEQDDGREDARGRGEHD